MNFENQIYQIKMNGKNDNKKKKTSDEDTTEVLILIPTPAGGDGIGTRCFN